MQIVDIKNKYLEIKKVLMKLSPNTDFSEYDVFFNSLKKFEKYEVEVFAQQIKQFNPSQFNDKKQKKKERSIEEILLEFGFTSFNFNEADMSKLLELEDKDLLSKKELVTLASNLGISKKIFKTKQEVYQEIKRFIVNRDILINIQETLDEK